MVKAKYKGEPRFLLLRNGHWLDRKERINFNRSKYIPGNGPQHRLGKVRGDC